MGMAIHALDGVQPDLPAEDAYWIAASADVIGRVSLGRDCSVWFNAVLRGDNEPMRVGEGSNIQDGAVCHSDTGFPLTIGRMCTIGHKAILHGCTIADGSLVGMGATVLNGAQIGKGSLVGAHSLVTEGKIFPDHSLIVGAPAKAVRLLSAAQVAGLLGSAEHYILNWKRFAAGLTTVG
jgi:carbonic anhydrase/acetyltransferase-like protein (isoleucine patch superfamily)